MAKRAELPDSWDEAEGLCREGGQVSIIAAQRPPRQSFDITSLSFVTPLVSQDSSLVTHRL